MSESASGSKPRPGRRAFGLVILLAVMAAMTFGALGLLFESGSGGSRADDPDRELLWGVLPPEAPRAPTPYAPEAGTGLDVIEVASGFDEPVGAVLVPGTEASFVILERPGRISLVEPAGTRVLLDLGPRVGSEFIEQGLLGMAFHPGFAENGRAFVSYTDPDWALRIVEVAVDPTTLAVGDSETEVLVVPQDVWIHQGGRLAFGPDGMLWVGLGDGGGRTEPDPERHGQNPETLYGSLVRLDVDRGTPYAIPEGNAFPEPPGRPEIWSFGFRNPWSFTFTADRVVVFDVGESSWEEINVIPLDAAGSNFGWSQAEGADCVRHVICISDGELPALAIPHGEFCAVVGGPVYRGAAIDRLVGKLLFGDFCSGRMVAADLVGLEIGRMHVYRDLGLTGLTGFGVDALGEVYVTTLDGRLLKLVPGSTSDV